MKNRATQNSNAALPIGIDISSRTITAAQVISQGRGAAPLLSCAMTLERVTQGAIPGAEDVARLADRLSIAGFAGSDVVVGVPDELALTAVLELPPMSSGAPIDALARSEIARVHRREPELLACSRWTIPSPERAKPGTHTMAVAMEFASGEKLVDAFAAAQLRVIRIDSRVCALGRCASAASLMHDVELHDGLVGVIHLGYSRASLVMLHMAGLASGAGNPHDVADAAAGPRVVYERAIEAGGLTRVLSAMQSRLGIDVEVASALLRGMDGENTSAGISELLRASRSMVSEYFDSFLGEVQRSLHYAAQRYPSMPVRHVWVCGPGAEARGLPERLEALVQARVLALTPKSCFAVRVGSVLAHDAQCMIACGLSSGGASPCVQLLSEVKSKNSNQPNFKAGVDRAKTELQGSVS